jgi:nucleoside-diphosphate-sugar epimerase
MNLLIMKCKKKEFYVQMNENLILSFALKSRTRCFQFISSAYTAGSDHIECPEAAVNATHFTNVYEESRAHAENTISRRYREGDLP